MKKVLFATTALIATAGVAAADVTLSGSAEMGVFGGDTITSRTGAVTAVNTQFMQDIDVTFTMSGTTDAGLAFGTAIDLDESASGVDTDDAGVAVYISGAWGKLTLGDTDGGYDHAMGEVPTGGSIRDNQDGAGYNGNGGLDGMYDGQVLAYTYSMGGMGVAVSFELDDTNTGGAQRDAAMGLGLTYAADLGGTTVNVGMGYQQGEQTKNVEDTVTGFSVGSTVAGVTFGINYSQQSRQGVARDITHTGFGASYTVDALTLAVNTGRYEDGVMGAGAAGGAAAAVFDSGHEASHTGLAATYALGGGANFRVGYGNNDVRTGAGVKTSSDSWSMGLSMSF